MKAGRPLRFLGVTLGGWATARVVLLWPADDIAATVSRLIGTPPAAAAMFAIAPAPAPVAVRNRTSPVPSVDTTPPPPAMVTPSPVEASPLALVRATQATIPTIPPPGVPPSLGNARSRLAASAWLIARGGASAGLLGGQLGASQAGIRLTYALGAKRRVALSVRVASPLRGAGREAAFGIDWQPTNAPIHVIAEQRVSLDGSRGGHTVMLVGGFGPIDVAPGVRAEGYGQAGAIVRDGIERFADGAVRVTHPFATLGRARFDIGVGAWGGAQRGAARLDAGPSLGLSVAVGGKPVRLALDWRQRIAGDARPGSGPALSIGSDF